MALVEVKSVFGAALLIVLKFLTYRFSSPTKLIRRLCPNYHWFAMNISVAKVISGDRDPYASLCTPSYLRNKIHSSECEDPGIDGIFLKALQDYASYRFNIIRANEFGIGVDSELNSTFTYLRSGESCFVGPAFTQMPERDAVSKHFVPMEFAGYDLYFLKRYKTSSFSLSHTFRGEILVLMCLLLVANVFVHSIAKSSRHKKLFKIPLKLGFILISVVLNLFSSNLAIQSIQKEIDTPKLLKLSDLQNAVISGRLSLVLPGLKSVTGVQVTAALLQNTTKAAEKILKRKVAYTESQNLDTFNYLANSNNPKLLTILNSVIVDDGLIVKKKCHRVTKISGLRMFGPLLNGFYFARNESFQCSKFRKYIQYNQQVLQSFYKVTKNQYLMRKQENIKCSAQEVEFADQANSFVVLTNNFFENSIKSTLMSGFLVGLGAFLLEIVLNRIILMCI